MEHASGGLLALFVVFFASIVGGEVAMRLRMPAVVGQILAGVVIGASGFNWVPSDSMPVLNVLAELGAVFLLFSVGIETPFEKIGKVGAEAFRVALLGVIVPFILGFGWAFWSGSKAPEAAFVAAAFVATSAGITAKVLSDLGVIDKRFAQVILGAAVIDDVLAMLILTVVSSLAKGGGVDLWSIFLVLVQAVGFIFVLMTLGRKAARRGGKLLGKPLSPLSPWSLSIAMCIGVAVLASYMGLAAIIGAFLVGMILAETEYQDWIHEKLVDLNEFIVPFFFVVVGMSVDIRAFGSWPMVGTLLFITALATVGKLLGGWLGAKEHRAIIGIGMVPRGEVGVIVASLGKAFGVLSASTYSLLVAMSLLTSVVAAPVLAALVKRVPSSSTDQDE
ncbi:MAG: cation:proton antiporter [Armatimonadota bacterium]